MRITVSCPHVLVDMSPNVGLVAFVPYTVYCVCTIRLRVCTGLYEYVLYVGTRISLPAWFLAAAIVLPRTDSPFLVVQESNKTQFPHSRLIEGLFKQHFNV